MIKHTAELSIYYTPINLTKNIIFYYRLIDKNIFEIQWLNLNNIMRAEKKTIRRKRIIILKTK